MILERMECPGLVDVVTIRTRDAITARCPVDGKEDRYILEIEIMPAGWTVEVGSLARYLNGFTDREISAEQLAADVAATIKHSTYCGRCTVTADQVVGEALRLKVTATA